MTVNERIITALAGFGLPVKPDRYSGDAESYFVFNYTTMGMLFADDAPGVMSGIWCKSITSAPWG